MTTTSTAHGSLTASSRHSTYAQKRGASPTPTTLPPSGKNAATIIAIECLIEGEEYAADIAETLLCAERGEQYVDIHAQTHARLLRLKQYVEQSDMAAGVRHRLRRGSAPHSMKEIIYPTLLHELETSRIWQAYQQKQQRDVERQQQQRDRSSRKKGA